MKKTELLQEVRKMRFEEAYEGWKKGRLTQEEAARLLGVCDRTYRRYLVRLEKAQGRSEKWIKNAQRRISILRSMPNAGLLRDLPKKKN